MAGALFRLGGNALKLKIIGVGAVVFVLFLLLIGLFGAGIGGKAFADSCGKRGTPGVNDVSTGGGSTAQTPGSDTAKDQIANAKIIDGVAQDGHLSGRATLIALMTALQESTLLNLDHGDADSVGLFQQRPSAGWGTKAQIMHPTYAAHMFFFGDTDGSPRGLTDVPGWETMSLGKAAQAVQHSAYPDLYDGQEDAARQIAQEAGIDLERTGTGGQDQDHQPGTPSTDPNQSGDPQAECYPPDKSKAGAPFHDGNAPWPAAVTNPRSTAAAIAWAENEAANGTGDWYRACLAFVAQSYGWNFSGFKYAKEAYDHMPANMKHDHDRNPPPGALMFWDTGKRAGHVALYIGDGNIASNDIVRPGYIDIVPATDIETKWGATYLGWSPPYFPKGG